MLLLAQSLGESLAGTPYYGRSVSS